MKIKTTITESREVEKEIHFPYYYRQKFVSQKLVKALSINHTIEIMGFDDPGGFIQICAAHFNVEKEIFQGVQITAEEFHTALREAQERLSKELYPHDYSGKVDGPMRRFGQPLPVPVMDLLTDLRDHFDGRGDADFVGGDPGHYVPNEEMTLFGQITNVLEAAGYKEGATV